jgi:osmotically-inducible protein OsmY
MLKQGLLAMSLLVGAAACEKKDAPPTAAERKEAAAAQTEKARAEVAKERADQAVEAAKDRQDQAEDRLEVAKDRAEDTADKVDMDWKGPDEGWRNDWATFAVSSDRSIEKGEYMIERDADGHIVAWRKVKQVAGNAFSSMRDAALATEVKAKLAADEDTRATKIDVDVDEHTITLTGQARSAKEAGEAVRLALSTPGTEKVISRLTWKR